MHIFTPIRNNLNHCSVVVDGQVCFGLRDDPLHLTTAKIGPLLLWDDPKSVPLDDVRAFIQYYQRAACSGDGACGRRCTECLMAEAYRQVLATGKVDLLLPDGTRVQMEWPLA